VGKLGYPGQTTANILRAGLKEVNRTRPHAVILLLGGNDAVAASFMRGERRDAQVRASLKVFDSFVGEVRRRGTRAIMIMTIVPSIKPPWWKRLLLGSAPTELSHTINLGLKALAARRGALMLHPADVLLTERGTLRPGYRRDDAHWTPAAYRALDRQVLEALSSARIGCQLPR
jgi:lysophospholipase L1-like esterase